MTRTQGVSHVFDTMAGVEAAQLQTVLVQAEEVSIIPSFITSSQNCREEDVPVIKMIHLKKRFVKNISRLTPSALKQTGILRITRRAWSCSKR